MDVKISKVFSFVLQSSVKPCLVTKALSTATYLRYAGNALVVVGYLANAKDVIDGKTAKGITGAIVTTAGILLVGTLGAPVVIVGTALYAIVLDPLIFGE